MSEVHAPAVGIHDLALATTHHVLTHEALAAAKGIDPGKYRVGLGQDEFSVAAPDEDTVTLAAAAALPLLERSGTDGIRTLLLATESGIDQAKSAGVFVHRLLGLPSAVRVVELKQACYAGTAALQLALGIVARDPAQKVLVIASDIARYDLDSAGEPTQGAAAVAFLVTADPAILAIDPVSGVHSADVGDFWRPNDRSTPVVDGKLSIRAYLDALGGAWRDHQARGGVPLAEVSRFLYHQPFTRMAEKAHKHLAGLGGIAYDPAQIASGLVYNRRLGNGYTASLYAGLAALLDHEDDLAGQRVGLFSYGSGAVSEFFTGVVQPGYRERRRVAEHAAALDARVPVDVATYRALHASAERGSAEDYELPRVTRAPFRFAGVTARTRRYE